MLYRYSTLSKYDMCPLAYSLLQQGVPDLEAKLRRDGSLAHNAYYLYGKHCLDRGVPTDLDAMPAIAAAAGITPHGDLYEALIEPWLANGHMFPKSEIIDIEGKYGLDADGNPCAWDDPDVWLRGTVDVLRTDDADDAARLVDYKTGFDSHANPLQMKIYAWFVFAHYGHINRVVCEFDYTRFNVQRVQTFTRDDVPAIEAQVRGLVAAIEADTQFEATPGEQCGMCSYRHACTAKPPTVGSVLTEEDARKAVEALGLLGRDYDRLHGELKAWCTLNGPLTHNGAIWGHHAQGDDGFEDPGEFIDACIAAGVDPLPYLSVNNTKARKLKPRKTDWHPALAACLVNRRTTAFRAKKEHGE
jgi:hypothetical protein